MAYAQAGLLGGGSTSTESQEEDTVTFEDVANWRDLNTDAARDAVSDDQNLDDTVDATTTVTTDDGTTATPTTDSDGEGSWSTVTDSGVDTSSDPFSGDDPTNQGGSGGFDLGGLPSDEHALLGVLAVAVIGGTFLAGGE